MIFKTTRRYEQDLLNAYLFGCRVGYDAAKAEEQEPEPKPQAGMRLPEAFVDQQRKMGPNQ